jgi:hypothetical protein
MEHCTCFQFGDHFTMFRVVCNLSYVELFREFRTQICPSGYEFRVIMPLELHVAAHRMVINPALNQGV